MNLTEVTKYKECADNPPQNDKWLKIHKQWKIVCISINGIKLRAGSFPAKINPPKANIIYLEGLADSMYNHDRLINTLSEAGYRTIAFDYPGQGGSEGSMDQTRITAKESSWDSIHRFVENDHKENDNFSKFIDGFKKHKSGSSATLLIRDMAESVWTDIKSANNIDPKERINAVIGWSTGGLAAYEMVKKNSKKEGIKAVVLIAPGTKIKPVIEIKTDTLNGNQKFQHLDNIRPDSPLKIPGFTLNLLTSGHAAENWKVADDVKGLVLLSDPKNDSYVDIEKVEKTLRRNAKHFEFVNYDGAAHEIDNESDEHRTDTNRVKLEVRVVNYLDRVFG
jgi:alpha-beta hydrolase superfamily lysophospholipase